MSFFKLQLSIPETVQKVIFKLSSRQLLFNSFLGGTWYNMKENRTKDVNGGVPMYKISLDTCLPL